MLQTDFQVEIKMQIDKYLSVKTIWNVLSSLWSNTETKKPDSTKEDRADDNSTEKETEEANQLQELLDLLKNLFPKLSSEPSNKEIRKLIISLKKENRKFEKRADDNNNEKETEFFCTIFK